MGQFERFGDNESFPEFRRAALLEVLLASGDERRRRLHGGRSCPMTWVDAAPARAAVGPSACGPCQEILEGCVTRLWTQWRRDRQDTPAEVARRDAARLVADTCNALFADFWRQVATPLAATLAGECGARYHRGRPCSKGCTNHDCRSLVQMTAEALWRDHLRRASIEAVENPVGFALSMAVNRSRDVAEKALHHERGWVTRVNRRVDQHAGLAACTTERQRTILKATIHYAQSDRPGPDGTYHEVLEQLAAEWDTPIGELEADLQRLEQHGRPAAPSLFERRDRVLSQRPGGIPVGTGGIDRPDNPDGRDVEDAQLAAVIDKARRRPGGLSDKTVLEGLRERFGAVIDDKAAADPELRRLIGAVVRRHRPPAGTGRGGDDSSMVAGRRDLTGKG